MKSNITVHGLTEVGKVRKANEDNWGERQTANGHIVVVCDGMGGHANGALASRLAVQNILDYCERVTTANPIILIHEAIRFANAQIHGHASAHPECMGMGTTCVVVLSTVSGQVYYGHVGDSRLYLFDGRKLHRVTRDHSLVQALVDSGQIRPEEMDTHPDRNKILKALGIDENVAPDVCVEPLRPGRSTMLLLCSDGLSGMIRDTELARILSQSSVENREALNQRLIDAAMAAGGTDNITCVLIGFPSAAASTTPMLSDQSSTGTRRWIGWLVLSLLVLNFACWYFFIGRGGPEKDVSPKDTVGVDTPRTAPPVVPEKQPKKVPEISYDSSQVFLDSAHAAADRKEWRKSRSLLNKVKDPEVSSSFDYSELKIRVDREISVLDSVFLQSQFRKVRSLTAGGKAAEAQSILTSIRNKKNSAAWVKDSLVTAEKRLAGAEIPAKDK